MPIYSLSGGAGAIVARKNGATKPERLYAVNGILSVGEEFSEAMKSHVANGSAVEIKTEEVEAVATANKPDTSNVIAKGIARK